MQKRQKFLLEIELDRSYFEKKGKRKVFHYKTESIFISVTGKDARAARNRARSEFLKVAGPGTQEFGMIVTTRFFKAISSKGIA